MIPAAIILFSSVFPACCGTGSCRAPEVTGVYSGAGQMIFSESVAGLRSKLDSLRYASLVDPFIGTGGHGHTYPGASSPFGMVQLSPDTRLTGWDGCSAYHYSDNHIYGFSHTHLSGTGCSDYGDILIMPVSADPFAGDGSSVPEECGASFDHSSEHASPGYYSVHLNSSMRDSSLDSSSHGVTAELTVTERCGFHRYSFDPGDETGIFIDLDHRDRVLDSSLRISGKNEVEGFRRSEAWAADQHVYFVARFSRPIFGSVISGNRLFRDSDTSTGESTTVGAKGWFGFERPEDGVLLVKVGISAVSMEGARKNLEAEIPGWDFDRIVVEAARKWDDSLGRVRVSGGSAGERATFYTALYHSMLAPNLFSDVDGRYRGRDLEVHRTDGFDYYTVFSLWDTYRASHPLFTIIEPERTVDFIETFLRQYEEGGMLPVWELGANETGCMIGYHAVPVIADAWVKGIRGFDASLALEAMKHSATRDHLGLEYYKKYGFIPSEFSGQSVSRTLEYAYDDWCIAVMAGGMGMEEDAARFMRRAQNYRNVFDPSTGFMRARMNGGWVVPFDPDEVNYHYTEANAWQYSFYVPQDVSGLARMMSGLEMLEARLDSLFTRSGELKGFEAPDVTGLIGQYAHGNEPSQHMAYLYNFTGSPWKTQQRVREIMDGMYRAAPDGLCGNEDCGQMSAWYVLSAMGFYPVTPGSDKYIIGSPLFEKIEIDTGGGNVFAITARGVSDSNYYIQSSRLNGSEWTKSWISHSDIVSGGTLEFEMGPSPSKWGSGKSDLPVSSIEDHIVCPVPFVEPAVRSFTGSMTFSLSCSEEGAGIFYTLDGSCPHAESAGYSEPITLDRSATLKAVAVKEGMSESSLLEAVFQRISGDISVSLTNGYNSMYTGGGDLGLVDLVRGSVDFKTGGWQGYRGVDFEAVLDLQGQRKIQSISAGFLHDQRAWIFMPRVVEFAVSSDGKDFRVVAVLENDIDDRQSEAVIREMTAVDLDETVRFVRVRAESMGICPGWHVGAGGKAWIFIDEVIVE